MRSRLTLRPLLGAAALVLATASAAPAGPPALDPANMDTTCAPCRDFFTYANGGWLRHADIPATESRWGSFDELAERNRRALVAILDAAAADHTAKPASPSGMLGAYWTAALDSARADALGAKPLAPLLAPIDRLRSARELAARLGAMHDQGLGGLFSFRAAQDPGASAVMIATAGQGGLGLPDRDYYFRADSAARAVRAEYTAHIERALTLAGRSPAQAKADAAVVMSLETELARASMDNVRRRDPKAVYHRVPFDSLRAAMPSFDWDAYLAARGAKAPATVNVTQPEFFRAVGGLLDSRTTAAWQAYLRWNVVDGTSPYLSKDFADEAFRFERVMNGAAAQAPRWKRALRWTDGDLGDLLGQAYVREHFPPAARDRALAMVRNLEDALADRLASLDWMSEATRQAALVKLRAFANHIGYPETWRDYAGVTVARDGLLANHLSARRYESRRNLGRIGQPVERGEWSMTAPTVNAFYSSSLNSINFPAGILQPPFYDPSWDDATNYGGIGAVIGHEMTHGFDDRGRQFDARGDLRDWWTADDAANYRARADKVADQYAGYTVLDTLHLNGRLTLGENIADLGGVAVAYHALQRALAGKPRETIDGFTPEQRFFLSYAQIWRQVIRPAALRTRVQTDPHSPAVWRVNGTLSSLPEFEQAFGCKPGDAMVREAALRTRIW